MTRRQALVSMGVLLTTACASIPRALARRQQARICGHVVKRHSVIYPWPARMPVMLYKWNHFERDFGKVVTGSPLTFVDKVRTDPQGYFEFNVEVGHTYVVMFWKLGLSQHIKVGKEFVYWAKPTIL